MAGFDFLVFELTISETRIHEFGCSESRTSSFQVCGDDSGRGERGEDHGRSERDKKNTNFQVYDV